jgi:hypothetical protein
LIPTLPGDWHWLPEFTSRQLSGACRGLAAAVGAARASGAGRDRYCGSPGRQHHCEVLQSDLHSAHFLDESLAGLLPELFLGNLLSSPSTPVLAYPLAGIRYRRQVAEQSVEEVARQPSTASFAGVSLAADAVGAECEYRGGVPPQAGAPAGTEDLGKACRSWLVATNCVFVTRFGPTCLGSSSH